MTSIPETTVKKILFTVDEAAAQLGVSPSWLYLRTSKKVIPFRKLGKYVRFSESDIKAIVDQAEAA